MVPTLEKLNFQDEFPFKNWVMFRLCNCIKFPWVYCQNFSPDTSTNIARWDSTFVVSRHLCGFAIFVGQVGCLKRFEVSNINKETINTHQVYMLTTFSQHIYFALVGYGFTIIKNLQKLDPTRGEKIEITRLNFHLKKKLGAIVKSCLEIYHPLVVFL